VKLLKKLGIHELPGGLKVEDFDYMHTLIYVDEVCFYTFLPLCVLGF
jgi:acyl-CoA dehydrogenase